MGWVGGAESFVGGIDGEEDCGNRARGPMLASTFKVDSPCHSRDQVGNDTKHGFESGVTIEEARYLQASDRL